MSIPMGIGVQNNTINNQIPNQQTQQGAIGSLANSNPNTIIINNNINTFNISFGGATNNNLGGGCGATNNNFNNYFNNDQVACEYNLTKRKRSRLDSFNDMFPNFNNDFPKDFNYSRGPYDEEITFNDFFNLSFNNSFKQKQDYNEIDNIDSYFIFDDQAATEKKKDLLIDDKLIDNNYGNKININIDKEEVSSWNIGKSKEEDSFFVKVC